MENNLHITCWSSRSKITILNIYLHFVPCSHTYIFFYCSSYLSTWQRSHTRDVSSIKRLGSLYKCISGNFRLSRALDKQLPALHTTVLPCLSTGATVLPTHSGSLRLPTTTSLTSITSQQAGEETWTLWLYHKFHKFPCATGHSSGSWRCAFWSYMDYVLLSVFKHSVRITRSALLGKKMNIKLKKQPQNLTFICSLLWALREPVWLPKRWCDIWIPATQS